VFDVSNRHRLGYSEVQLVQTMLDGLEKLIELEKRLENGETVTL
jgi:creatine kinase